MILCKKLHNFELAWTIRHCWIWLWNHSTVIGIPYGIFQGEGTEPQQWLKLVDVQSDSILRDELERPESLTSLPAYVPSYSRV